MLPDPPSNPRLSYPPPPPRVPPPDQNPNTMVGIDLSPWPYEFGVVALGIIFGIVTGVIAFVIFGIGR